MKLRKPPDDIDLSDVDLLDTRCVPLDGESPGRMQRRLRTRIDRYHAEGGRNRFATHLIEPLDSIALLRIH